jgi:translation initiation factor IF-1
MNNGPVTPGQQTQQTAPTFHQKLKEGQYGFAGQVIECLPNTMFQVEISSSDIPQLVGTTLLCTLAGKMRLNRIRVLPGDKVVGYVTKYDLTHGKITFRTK